jgi:hypothetical protein
LSEKKQWEEERAGLRLDVRAAQDRVLGKNGEISIIRANHTRQEKENERTINELKRQQAEAEERHKQALEQAKKEKESLITHNRFLDHEANDNAWQNAANRNAKSKAAGTVLTPRRQRTKIMGDGFDDDEIMISPSKSAGKSRGGTPKQGAKRKRDVLNESPSQSLQFNDEAGSFLQDASAALKEDAPGKPATIDQDSRFDFLQMLISHRVQPGMKRTFEAFATFTFPSNPNVAVSTLLLDKLSANNSKRDKQDFPGAIGLIILSIWSKCLDEHYVSSVSNATLITELTSAVYAHFLHD